MRIQNKVVFHPPYSNVQPWEKGERPQPQVPDTQPGKGQGTQQTNLCSQRRRYTQHRSAQENAYSYANKVPAGTENTNSQTQKTTRTY